MFLFFGSLCAFMRIKMNYLLLKLPDLSDFPPKSHGISIFTLVCLKHFRQLYCILHENRVLKVKYVTRKCLQQHKIIVFPCFPLNCFELQPVKYYIIQVQGQEEGYLIGGGFPDSSVPSLYLSQIYHIVTRLGNPVIMICSILFVSLRFVRKMHQIWTQGILDTENATIKVEQKL